MTGDVRSTCAYCGVGCGIVVRNGGVIAGDAAHPANHGRLCSKGAALGATLHDADRLVTPLVDGHAVDWDTAMAHVADRFRATINAHGPDSVAFYVSGQFLTEDYYVANKLMKGFIGSANIDTNSRLCMASSVAGHVRAFGEDVVPGTYEDWDEADLVVLVGSNTAWCHPVLYQRLLAARENRGTQVMVIDPRRTPTAEASDLHLAIAPGSDVLLFNGLLAFLAARGFVDAAFVSRHVAGCDDAVRAAAAQAGDSDAVAAACDIDPGDLRRFYEAFARTERVLTVYSQGVNQSECGTDKVNAIINCHLATGRIGRPGMGPFSVTGQPNAMGGREVGGLANQLAAHMRLDDPAHRAIVQRFWNAPRLPERPGLKAVELFDAMRDGRVKAVWIAATNPAVSLPRSNAVREALEACPFVVVSDCWHTDTSAYAHVVLPAAGWGEKDGTVTNSERRISRQRAFRAAPGEARADWWMFAELGRRLGWAEAFAWESPAAVFREHASLSAFENNGARCFNIGALSGLDDAAYDAMAPVRWPATGGDGRFFADGGFPTADGRARMVKVTHQPVARGKRRYVLNTGRVRDQWHTMTRTGLSPRLMAHTSEPVLTLHPFDAASLGVADHDLVRVTSAAGSVTLRADVRFSQRPGEVFAPMHWTDAFASCGPVEQVVTGGVDPVSGQPALKATPVSLEKVQRHYAGLLLRRRGGALPSLCRWVRVPAAAGHMYRLDGLVPPVAGDALTGFAASLLQPSDDAELLELIDTHRGVLRVAVIVDGVLDACLFLAPIREMLPDEAALAPLLGTRIAPEARSAVLAGRAGTASSGPHICACFGVSHDRVRAAVAEHRLDSVAGIGRVLRAGSNCGSCIPELQEILRDAALSAA